MQDLVTAGVIGADYRLTSSGVQMYAADNFSPNKPGYCPIPVAQTSLEQAKYFEEQARTVMGALDVFRSIDQNNKDNWLRLMCAFSDKRVELIERIMALSEVQVLQNQSLNAINQIELINSLGQRLSEIEEQEKVLLERISLLTSSINELQEQVTLLPALQKTIDKLTEMLDALNNEGAELRRSMQRIQGYMQEIGEALIQNKN